MKEIRWGIMATGSICRTFVKEFEFVSAGRVEAVSSRNEASAQTFAKELKIPQVFPSHEALAASDQVDVIYIGSPHTSHFAMTKLCLEHGKHVLCEKPLTLNSRQSKELYQLAQDRGCFLMEAMWSRFNPALIKAKQLVDSGEIGDVIQVQANFGFVSDDAPDSRLRNPELAGGALLDVGIYPLFLAQLLLGAPESINSRVKMGPTGVDLQEDIWLGYGESDARATLSAAIDANYPITCFIAGSKGRIDFDEGWFFAKHLWLTTEQFHRRKLEFPFEGMGYSFEAEHVQACIRDGLLESPLFSHEDSLQLMATMDHLRDEWGLVYPSETQA